jgi:2,4-dienoyl-CoA reductase-like NADH-dependent reductase (Old Yellow Enzyme family)
MASYLFSPIRLGAITLPNRVMVSPMCQYSAEDGVVSAWHTVHLGQFALSGAALVVVEATGVEAEGRITPGCTGLYSAQQEEALAQLVDTIHRTSKVKVGIQLAHAGRKASSRLPWEGGQGIATADGGWRTVAPPSKKSPPLMRAPRIFCAGQFSRSAVATSSGKRILFSSAPPNASPRRLVSGDRN